MYDNEVLKKYFKDKKYDECISMLKSKITSFVVNKIKNIDSTFEFTTVSDLISASIFNLNDSEIALKLQNALSYVNLLEQIEELISICEKYEIK